MTGVIVPAGPTAGEFSAGKSHDGMRKLVVVGAAARAVPLRLHFRAGRPRG